MQSNRRDFLKTALSVGMVPALRASALAGATATKPNLLFVFTDQQSFDMLGCYGNRQILTPHLDRLAGEGVRFEYCVASSPVCTPSRAMMLTGQHPLRNGALSNDVAVFPGNGAYFAEVLRDRGYRTGYIGKWHLYGGDRNRPVPAGPDRCGFDDTFLTNNCSLNFDPDVCFYFDQQTGQKVRYGQWEAYGQTEQAVDFINRSRPGDPWALFVSWHPPHDHKGLTYGTLPELEAQYDAEKITLRPSMTDSPKARRNLAGYMAMCTGCDLAFGRLMATLRAKGMEDNTVVVFTSDHGDLHGAHGRPWAKSFPEDESCRVPLIIRYPGKLKPRRSELLVGTLDLMPTILGLMGIAPPSTCDGQNLTPHLVTGDDRAVESVPFFYAAPAWRGVFTKRFTYSERAQIAAAPDAELLGIDPGKQTWNCLYDRQDDPFQLKNRFDDSSWAPKKDELQVLMHRWRDRFRDPFLNEVELIRALGGSTWKFDGPGKSGRLAARPIELLQGHLRP